MIKQPETQQSAGDSLETIIHRVAPDTHGQPSSPVTDSHKKASKSKPKSLIAQKLRLLIDPEALGPLEQEPEMLAQASTTATDATTDPKTQTDEDADKQKKKKQQEDSQQESNESNATKADAAATSDEQKPGTDDKATAGGTSADKAPDGSAESGKDEGVAASGGGTSDWSWLIPAGLIGGAGIAIAASSNGSSSTPSTPPATEPEPDTIAPVAANISLVQDTGQSSTDGLTSNGSIVLDLPDDVASWRYSVDGGQTWTNGAGESFELAAGHYAIGDIQVEVSDAAGNKTISSLNEAITVDTTSPTIVDIEVTGNLITLTLDSDLDALNLPALESFTVLLDGIAHPVTNIEPGAADNILMLTVSNIPAGTTVSVSYTDPSVNDDSMAIQDLAGNDLASFNQGIVADGYVRGAQLYADLNADGAPQSNELLVGVVTSEDGHFVLPAQYSAYPLLAVGGINIDNGTPNMIILSTPAESRVINPLTTLTQQVIVQAAKDGQTLSTEQAAQVVVQTLDLVLPGGTSLLTFDPIAATQSSDLAAQDNALSAQKAALQLATLMGTAQLELSEGGAQSLANAATQILQANNNNQTLSFADPLTVESILQGLVTDSDIENAKTSTLAIANATTLDQAATEQAKALDQVDPLAPEIELLSESVTNQNQPIQVRASLDTGSLDGQAVVAGDVVNLYGDGDLLVSVTIDTNDITAGFVDLEVPARDEIGSTELAEGTVEITAVVTDRAANQSGVSNAIYVDVDLTEPQPAIISALSVDSGRLNDQLTSDTTPSISVIAEADTALALHRLTGDESQLIAADGLTVSATNDGYRLDIIRDLPDGRYGIGITDLAGNESAVDAVTSVFVIDTVVEQSLWSIDEQNDVLSIVFGESMMTSSPIDDQMRTTWQQTAQFIDAKANEDQSGYTIGDDNIVEVFFDVSEGDIILADTDDFILFNAATDSVEITAATPSEKATVAALTDTDIHALDGLLSVQLTDNSTGTAWLLGNQDNLLFVDDQVIASLIDEQTDQLIERVFLVDAHQTTDFSAVTTPISDDTYASTSVIVTLAGESLMDLAANPFDNNFAASLAG